MIKRIVFALLLFFVAAPAYATEINTDVGCDNPAAWTLGTGWSVSGSKCVASSATRMSMIEQSSNLIKEGHVYKVTADVTITGGQMRFFVGLKMNASVDGTWVPESSVAAIPDNFTLTDGLTTTNAVLRSTTGPGDDPERNGSMRVACVSAGVAHVDPLVWNGVSTPHLHEFVGASNIKRNWTYTDFRTKAESSCTNQDDPTHTVNRSGYWFPAVLGSDGSIHRTAPMLVYYKGPPSTTVPDSIALTGSISGTTLTVTSTGGVTNPISPDGEFITGTGIPANTQITSQLSGTPLGVGTYQLNNSATVSSETITLISPYKNAGNVDGTAASMCAAVSYSGTCVNVPRGIAFTFGWKGQTAANTTTDNNCGPDDTVSVGSSTTERCSIRGVSGEWQCTGGPNGEGASPGVQYTSSYLTLHDIMAANVCVVGSYATRSLSYPSCWDGVNAMAPDHRSHVSWGDTNDNCKIAAHPVEFTRISLLLSYLVDQDFLNGGWHLATDEMAYCYDTLGLAGCTEHGDYFEAWSDTARDDWYQYCNLPHNSCTNDLGNGYMLKAANKNYDGTTINRPIFGEIYQQNEKEAPETHGESHTIKTSGTYTYYITAIDDGVWGILGMKQLSGTLDNIHIQDMGVANKGPVTVHN